MHLLDPKALLGLARLDVTGRPAAIVRAVPRSEGVDVGEHRASPAGRVGADALPGERYQLVDRRWVVVAGRRRQARQARHQSLEQCPRCGGA
jgi:hypothetical protein